MGFLDKHGIATSTAIGMILLVIGLLIAMGLFGPRILEAAEGIAKTFGIETQLTERVNLPADLLASFFLVCAAEKGTNCICSESIDFYLPDAFSEGNLLTLEEKNGNIEIDLVGARKTVPNVVPCFVRGFPTGFADLGYFTDRKVSRSFPPEFSGKVSFEYKEKGEQFWFKRTLANSLPMKTLRLIKLDPNYLCLMSSGAVNDERGRTCRNIDQCFGRVCGTDEKCPTNKIDPYYTGPGLCCDVRCVKKEAPEIEAGLKQKLKLARVSPPQQALKLLNEIYNEHPTSEFADDALFEIAKIKDSLGRREEVISPLKTLLKQYPGSELIAEADKLSDKHMNCGDYNFKEALAHSAKEMAKCTDARDSLLIGCVFIDRNWPIKNNCKSCRDIKYACDIYDEETCKLSPCHNVGEKRCSWFRGECQSPRYKKDCSSIKTSLGCANDPCHPKTTLGCCVWTGSKCKYALQE